MPQNLLGTVSRNYIENEQVKTPYYGCTVAYVEPKVEQISARLMPGARVAVFGEYEIMILFTYTDAAGKTVSFLQPVRKTFSELVDISELIKTLGPAEIADIGATADFTPQVVCRREKRISYLWNIDVSGAIQVTLTVNEPEAKPEPVKPMAHPVQAETQSAKEIPAPEQAVPEPEADAEPEPETEQETETAAEAKPAPEPAVQEQRGLIGSAKCWRLGTFGDLSFDDLCNMTPDEIDKRLGRDM